jgi:hypothetical protein
MTKATGHPRGRPPKPKTRQPPGKRGGPAQTIQGDQDRFSVALLQALLAFEMSSERQCALLVAAIDTGHERGSEQASEVHSRVQTSWEKAVRRGAAASFEGRAASLRGKLRKYLNNPDPHARRWLVNIASACMLAIGAKDKERAKMAALARAGVVGEEEFARQVLWPMIDAKN